jgi:hypothetical protein
MSEEQQQAASSKVDIERIRQVYAEFRESHRDFIDACAKSFDRATDLNKQSAAFYERVLLLNMGILGFSITALTAVSSRFHFGGFFKYTIASLVGLAWLGLLVSTLFCASIVLDVLRTNRRLYAEWLSVTFDAHAQTVSGDMERFAQITGIALQGDPVDKSALLSQLAEDVRKSTGGEWKEHLQAMIKPPEKTSSTQESVKYAIRSLQLSLLLLGIVAMLLFISAK